MNGFEAEDSYQEFKELFAYPSPWIIQDFMRLITQYISMKENKDFIRVSLVEEIKQVVWKKNPLKALDPDCF